MHYHILYVDLEHELVILEEGIIPIVHYYDEDGDEVPREESTWCSAGDASHGFTAIHYADLPLRTVH